jgi:exonuclease SbcC
MNRIDKVSRVVGDAGTLGFDPVEDQLETLRMMLTEMKVSSESIEQITNMHADRIRGFETAKWHINRLTWSNMFKYTSGDIDFDRIAESPGIAGVIADNMSGKSSIFDILVWGLFGKLLRGDRKSMIRHGQKSAATSVYFTSNGVSYLVARADKSHTKHEVTLHKFNDATNQFDINLSAKATNITYDIISKLVGGYEQFLSTGLYYDGINDIVRMNTSDRKKVFPELFGMTDNTTLVKDLKAAVKNVKEKISKLIAPRQENDPAPELATKKMDKEQLEQQIDKFAPIIENARLKLVAAEDALKKYETLAAQLSRAQKDKPTISTSYDEVPSCSRPASELTREITAAAKQEVRDIEVIRAELDEARNMLPDELKQCNKSRAELEKTVSNCEGRVAAIRERIEQDKKEVERMRASLLLVEKERAAKQDDLERMVTSQLSGNTGLLKFAPDSCQCCSHNQSLVGNASANTVQDRMKEVRDLEKKVGQLNAAISDKESAISMSTVECDKYRGTYSERMLGFMNENIEVLARVERLNKEMAQSAAVKSALNIVEAHTQWDAWQKYTKYREQQIKAEKIQIAVDLYQKQIDELGSIDKIKKDLKKHKKTMEESMPMLAILRADYTKTVSEVNRLTTETDIYVEYHSKFPGLDQERIKLESYLECVNNEKLQQAIARKHSDRIIIAANDILRGVSNFTITNEGDGIFSDLYIVDGATKNKVPVSMGSGYQRFIVSIAFRIAFTTNLYNSPQFLCIDEGFGCMDNANTSKLSELFGAIRSNFKFVFIISHIVELQNMVDCPLYITDDPTTISNAVTAAPSSVAVAVLPTITAVNDPNVLPSADAESIVCECGHIIKKKSLTSHRKTKKHLNGVAALSGQ